MRLLFHSSAVAAIVVGSAAPSIASRTKRVASTSQTADDDKWSRVGIECDLAASASAHSQPVQPVETRPDIGLLSPCHPLRQVCAPDELSSLGGRCRDKVQQQRPRFLEEEEFVCPATCPGELCDCASNTYYGFPDAQDCAFEVHAVCLTGDVADCFDADYSYFYSYVYCPFSECWLDGSSYDECVCGYYRDYCDLYGEYADGYPEIAEKCAVSECCEGAAAREERVACLPEGQGISSTDVTGPSEDEDSSDGVDVNGEMSGTAQKPSEDEDSSDRVGAKGEKSTRSWTEDPSPEGGIPAGGPTGESPEDASPRSVSPGTNAASKSSGAGGLGTNAASESSDAGPRTTDWTAATALLGAAGLWLCA